MSLILLALACQGTTDTSNPLPQTTGDTATTPPTTDVTLAHTGTTTDTAPGTTTSSETGTTTDTVPLDLNGSVPAVALPPPVFTAVRNRDTTPRSQSDLTDGHPTVLWFYPAAGTAG